MTRDEARARIYAMLALPLLDPTEDDATWQSICSGQWAGELRSALAELGSGLDVPATLGARSCRRARQEYLDALVLPDHPVRPVESLHKPWTEDPTAVMPMAREKGWLGGDAALHLQALFAALGIAVPAGFSHAPDHLALELELMSLLVEQGSPEQQELFRRQHLDWLADLCEDARRRGAPPFYQQHLELTTAFVAQDHPQAV